MVTRGCRRVVAMRTAWLAPASLLVAVLLVAVPAAAQEVSARVEPATVGLGQTAELVIEIDAGALGDVGEPRIPEMAGISVVGRSREARVMLSGGRIHRRSVFRYTLLATGPGVMQIDPVQVKLGDRTVTTPPMRLVVLPTGGEPLLGRERGSGGEGPPPVFAVTRVDRRRAWVGEQVTLTFAFYHDPSYPLAESPDYEPPETPGFWRMEIDRDPIVALEQIGGRAYHVQRFRYALFPLRAGELAIGSARVRLVEADRQRWWQPGRSRTIETEPLRLTIEALPPPPPGFAGAVGSYDLDGAVRPRRTVAGTPVELELKVRGTGNPNSIGPPALPAWPDIRVRPPTVDAATRASDEEVRGEKIFRFLLVPEEPGRMGLGEARLPYFDPAKGEYRVDTLRLGEIAVAPDPGLAASTGGRSAEGPRLWPARHPSSPRGRDFGIAGEAWAWLALAGPWAGWIGVAALRVAWRRRPRDRARRPIAALRRARRALGKEEPAALARAEQALEDSMVARFGTWRNASPREGRRSLLAAGATAELVDDWESARAALAAARYGGGSLQAAAEAIGRVEGRLHRSRRGRRRTQPRGTSASVTLIVLVMIVASAPAASASPTDGRSQAAGGSAGAAPEAWLEANRSYRAGDFARAERQYDALLSDWADARLEADLAATLWRAGRRGEALAHYLHALDQDPHEPTIRRDLDRLRTSLGHPPDARSSITRALARVTLDELVLLLLFANGVAFGLFLLARVRPEAKGVALGSLLSVIVCAGVVALHAWTVERPSWVVTGRAAEIRPSPGATRAIPAIAIVPEGAVLRVLERGRHAWRVQPRGLPAGWLARDRIVPIDSRRRAHAE